MSKPAQPKASGQAPLESGSVMEVVIFAEGQVVDSDYSQLPTPPGRTFPGDNLQGPWMFTPQFPNSTGLPSSDLTPTAPVGEGMAWRPTSGREQCPLSA